MNSSSYKELLNTLAMPSVRLGYSAVCVYCVDELEEAQVGYSVDSSGASLIDGEPGSWQRKWVVIGYEEGCGDPIFIDVEADGFPVYTAIHGSGSWEPALIAVGLRNFATTMKKIAALAKGRENPTLIETNPITPSERATILGLIQQRNPEIDSTFWEILLGYGSS